MPKKTKYPYNPALKEKAKELRNSSTLSEVRLWKHLRNKQMLGYDFDRQKPIDNFIIDFFCDELKLAIAIDGSSHIDKGQKDKKRQQKIEEYGIRFLRFSDLEVKNDIENVMHAIENWIKKNKNSGPSHKNFGVALDYNYFRDPFE